MAWNGSGGAANLPRKDERRRTAGTSVAPRPVLSAKGKSPLSQSQKVLKQRRQRNPTPHQKHPMQTKPTSPSLL